MKRNKPDLLLILIALFGLGLVVSAYTHANRQDKTATPSSAAIIVRP